MVATWSLRKYYGDVSSCAQFLQAGIGAGGGHGFAIGADDGVMNEDGVGPENEFGVAPGIGAGVGLAVGIELKLK